MINEIIKITILFITLLLIPALGFAQEVSSEIVMFRVFTDDSGIEKLGDASFVEPEDTVEYQVAYTNHGISSISSLEPILPVPEGFKLSLKESKESKKAFQVSLDGKSFQNYPILKSITMDSRIVFIPVEDHEYRYVKWVVESLNAGETVVLKARMNVL
ncbi:hypothetical protein [Gracilimonas sp.]|uniref:hypothetical protein n=1 Tax=Gracilimonas sp. TaxID=1974203 RepID=UPI003BAAAA76